MDVAAWLRGLGLEQYARAFRDNDVDGEVLPELRAMQDCHSLRARCFRFFAKKVFFNPVQGSVRNLTRTSASAMP